MMLGSRAMLRIKPIAAIFTVVSALSWGARAAPPDVHHHTCPNGLEVLVAENHAVPTLTVEIAAKTPALIGWHGVRS